MKTKHLLACMLCVLTFGTLQAQLPALQYVAATGGSGSDQTLAFTTDAAGNSYVAGGFNGTADFDPGSGTLNLNSNGGFDSFVQKLDAAGNLVWAKSWGGGSNDLPRGITTDHLGNVYIVGEFRNTVDFDPGPAVFSLISNGLRDIFIQKLDVNGDFVWARSFGGSDSDNGFSVVVDSLGNVYTTGRFYDVVDFDPGAGNTMTTSNGGLEIFVQRLDSNGMLDWVYSFGGSDFDSGNAIHLDESGDLLVGGSFSGTVDFDPGMGVANRTAGAFDDAFLLKLDTAGNFIWVNSALGSVNSNSGINAISTDSNGNIHLVGEFSGTVDFDPGSGVAQFTSNGVTDVYIQKLDASGNSIWTTAFGGPDVDEGVAIDVDPMGNIYASGSFDGTVDFDPGPGVTSYTTSFFGRRIFMTSLDGMGQFRWAEAFGETFFNEAFGIRVNDAGTVLLAGDFGGTVDFNPRTGVTEITSEGSNDIFVAAFNQCFADTGLLDTVVACAQFTWPVNGITYTVSGNYQQVLQNATGCDSLLLLNLTFNTVDVGVTQANDTLLAVTGASAYQWLDCSNNAAIPGANNSFYVPQMVGDYAVVVTENGCTDTSSCVTWNCTTTDTVFEVACFQYFWPENGVTYTLSGIYTDTLTNALGCDSIRFLDLTIQTVDTTIANFNDTLFASPGATSYQWINCNSGSPIAGATDVQFYPSSNGTYAVVITSNGCIDTSACQAWPCISRDTTFIQSCTAFDWNGTTYNTSGLFASSTIFTNVAGCDSIPYLALTIDTLSNAVMVNGATLTAVDSGWTYQWFDCVTGINLPGETNQSFTAVADGDYAVIISGPGCQDTSNCTAITNVGLAEIDATLPLLVYPNPTSGQVTLELAQARGIKQIIVATIDGRVLRIEPWDGLGTKQLQLNYPAGVYLLTVEDENGTSATKRIHKF